MNKFLELSSGGLTITLIMVIFLVYQCILKHWFTFTKNGVKFVRGIPIFGTHYPAIFGRISLATSLQDVYTKYPDEQIIGMYDLLGKPIYLVTDPELFRSISIKLFDHFKDHRFSVNEDSDLLGRCILFQKGKRWKEMRSMTTPFFSSTNIRSSHQTMVRLAVRMINHLKMRTKYGPIEFDMEDMFTRLTIDMMAACNFGLNIDSINDRNNQFLKEVLLATKFTGKSGLKAFLYGSIPKIMNYFKINLLQKSNADYFRHLVRNAISLAKCDEINFVQMFLKTAGKLRDRNFVSFQQMDDQDKSLIEDDIVAQCIILTLPSFLSITSCVCSALHEIAINPEIQEKLYNEIALTKSRLNDNNLTYDVLHQMKYLDMVVNEALRRWTPIPLTDRMVTKPINLDLANGRQIHMNIGDILWYPMNSIHLDTKYFPNPENFDPERFYSEDRSHNYAFTPFGNGPRKCIATAFGLIGVKTILFHMIDEFVWERGERTQIPLYQKRVPSILVPSKGKWIKIRCRNE